MSMKLGINAETDTRWLERRARRPDILDRRINPELRFAPADDTYWRPGQTIDEAEVIREMSSYMNISEISGLVEVATDLGGGGDYLVVSGHNPVYPSCAQENAGRFCGDSDQPHKMQEWAGIPILSPPGGGEPDRERVVGDTGAVIQVAEAGASWREVRMRADMYRHYLDHVIQRLPDALDRWWESGEHHGIMEGTAPLLSEDEIIELGAQVGDLCQWVGKQDEGFAFTAMDTVGVPSYFDVLVALGDMDEDYPTFDLEFGWLGRDFSWFSLDTVAVYFK